MSSSDIKSVAELIQAANAFQKSRTLLTAFELDIFSKINPGGSSLKEIAGESIKNHRALERLLNVLVTLNLIKKKDNKFFLTELSDNFLVRGKENYLGGLMHTVHLWNSWSKLTEFVTKNEKPVIEEINLRGGKWLRAFIEAMHMRGRRRAEEIITHLDFSKVKKMLDVGGGSAVFSTVFIEQNPGVKATVFELPNVIPITEEYIHKQDMQLVIETISGDYLIDEFGNNYDLVLLSAIIHSNSYEENEKLIEKCCKVLNPGGQIIIVDYVMNEDRTEPSLGALFAINMLINTEGGDTYTFSEISSWLKRSGISKIKQIELSEGNSLVIGYK